MDWNRAYMRFMDYLKIKNYAPSTRNNYRKMLKPFKNFLQEKGIEDIRQVTRKHINEYIEKVKTANLTTGTQVIRFYTVSRFYRYFMKEGCLLINPCECMEIPKRYNLPRNILTAQEMERILVQPNISTLAGIRDRAILELLYSTGIRVGECESLHINDIRLKERLLYVLLGKGGKDRVIPIGKEALKWLREYIQMGRPRSNQRRRKIKNLFLSLTGAPMTRRKIRNAVRKYLNMADIKKRGVTCHSIRHTFATELLKNGADIVFVQRLLGHRDINTTLIYTKVAPVDVKRTHMRTHPGERKVLCLT